MKPNQEKDTCRMPRTSWTLLLIVAVLALAGPGVTNLGAQDIPDTFQNLQVLDPDISKEDLKEIMSGFTEQLGVKCTFCHELGEYHLDSNEHKPVARKMITLVNYLRESMELYFVEGTKDNQVGCWSCHRGEAEIEGWVPEEEDDDWI